MRHSITAPLLSGLILPGLGQIINRQFLKGLILIGLTTAIFLATFVKIILDLSVAMNQVMGPDLNVGLEQTSEIMAFLRAKDTGFLYVLMITFAFVWIYAVVDAYLMGRKYKMPQKEE